LGKKKEDGNFRGIVCKTTTTTPTLLPWEVFQKAEENDLIGSIVDLEKGDLF